MENLCCEICQEKENRITGLCLLEKISEHYGCSRRKILELMPELYAECPITDIQYFILDTISCIQTAVDDAFRTGKLKEKTDADLIRKDISVMMRRVYASHLERCKWTAMEFEDALAIIEKYTDWLYISLVSETSKR